MGQDPPASSIPPDLDGELRPYISYFWELHSCRQITMAGPGPIPWTAMREYAFSIGLGEYEDLLQDFMTYISALDAEYLMVSKEEMDRHKKQAEAQAKARKR